MRLGLVRFLNARPLDYGFRLQARENPHLHLVEETPSRLISLLLAGELDAALVSSVECFRNEATLGYCTTVGVCAEDTVQSILYIRRRSSRLPEENFFTRPVRRVLVDSGSRSSVALLQILLQSTGGELPPFEVTDPGKIPERLQEEEGGLLIGDSALEFHESPYRDEFFIRDLARWWRERENLPFVFALWAYPREKPLSDSLFEESLRTGLEHLSVIAQESSYRDSYHYLNKLLHYNTDSDDLRALERFRSLLEDRNLL